MPLVPPKLKPMPSKREQIILNVIALLKAIDNGPRVVRDEDAPERVPPQGHVVVREGEREEPDRTIGSGAMQYYHVDHIDIEVYAIGNKATSRQTRLDRLLIAIDAAIESDRTLGGLALLVELAIEQYDDFFTDGAEPAKAALVDLQVEYETETALA